MDNLMVFTNGLLSGTAFVCGVLFFRKQYADAAIAAAALIILLITRVVLHG